MSGAARGVLLSPRWLALTVIAALAATACLLLGSWQWQRTQDVLAAERAALQQPADVLGVAPADGELPPEAMGRPVWAEGRYGPEEQVLIAQRELDGLPGSWVVSALRASDGSTIAVLRGWIPGDGPAGDPPAGPVRVDGVLQPDEGFYSSAGRLPDGRLMRIDAATLRSLWGPQVRSGFVVLQESDPAVAAGADAGPGAGEQPVPVPPSIGLGDVPFPLQNAFYSFQWWFFGVLVVIVWGRWLLLDVREARGREARSGASAAAG